MAEAPEPPLAREGDFVVIVLVLILVFTFIGTVTLMFKAIYEFYLLHLRPVQQQQQQQQHQQQQQQREERRQGDGPVLTAEASASADGLDDQGGGGGEHDVGRAEKRHTSSGPLRTASG